MRSYLETKMTKEELKKKKISAISLGCDKNKVDLQHMLFWLKEFGFEIVSDLDEAQIIIVNTCSFITPAKQESIDNILLAISKKSNNCEKVIVTGCLPQRNLIELQEALPEVDFFVQIKDNEKIVNIIEKMYGVVPSKLSSNLGRISTFSSGYAHLKIADGCNNGCSFCAIPRIRGRYRSVDMKVLLKEARQLCDDGYCEIILVAQDVTRYGFDLYGEYKLVELIENLSKIKKLKWIRLHYCYPELIDERLLECISKNEKVCKYLDIPLQHIDNELLKSMNRRLDEQQTRELIKNIKTNYPNITIRSTFIVGYPSESAKAFKKLCEFLKQNSLENVGFFKYYKEENTKAYFMKNQVREFVKNIRLKKIQNIQNQIAMKNNSNRIGQETEVMIDEFNQECNAYIGHDQFNSPDVDFAIMIQTPLQLCIGQIYKIKIVSYINNYFIGEIFDESSK